MLKDTEKSVFVFVMLRRTEGLKLEWKQPSVGLLAVQPEKPLVSLRQLLQTRG